MFESDRFFFGNGLANPTGWGYWRDAANTTGNRQLITGGVKTLFTVDGLSPTTETSYLESLPPSIWAGNTINPDGIGNTYLLRVDLWVSPQTAGVGHYVELVLDIGDGVVNEIIQHDTPMIKGNGTTHRISLTWAIFARETFNANGGKIYITPDIDIEVWDRAVFIQRGYTA